MFSVGQLLREERERQGIGLQTVEKQIKVREKFLKAIEENNWDNFSSKVYVTGIIKNYAKFLGLDSKKILAFFRRDYERKEDVKFKEKISSKYLTSETKKIAFFGLSLVFFLFFVYFSYQLKLYFSPPKIEIISPKENTIFKDNKVKIKGKTEKDVVINIFGERIYQDQQGVFEYNFPLKEGKNELIIEALGANGRKTILKKVFFKNDSLK